MAEIREEAGDRVGAEAFARQAADHGNTYALRLLAKRRQFDEAEKLMLAGRDVLEKALGKDSADARSAGEALAELYDAWGKPDEAARVRAAAAPVPSAP